jgi:hypothetical protein
MQSTRRSKRAQQCQLLHCERADNNSMVFMLFIFMLFVLDLTLQTLSEFFLEFSSIQLLFLVEIPLRYQAAVAHSLEELHLHNNFICYFLHHLVQVFGDAVEVFVHLQHCC